MIKVNIPTRAAKEVGIHDISKISVDDNGYLVKFKAKEVVPLTGKNPELKEEGVVNPSQLVLIKADMGDTFIPRPNLYFVTFNPILAQYGMVSAPAIITHQEISELQITFSCLRKIDLNELDYVIGVYING